MRPVNLLPEEYRARRPSGRGSGSAYVVLGVLGALLVCTAAYALTASQAASRNAEAAAASREAQRAKASAATLGAFGDFMETKQARTASVKALAGSRFDWERLMRGLARVLPSGAWLTDVDASLAPEASAAAGASSGGPSAKISGCADRQRDVASLMVRLRRVDRVKDVTLTESAREEAPSGAGGAGNTSGAATAQGGCDAAYKFQVDVALEALPSGSAPSPGGEGVPASRGGGP